MTTTIEVENIHDLPRAAEEIIEHFKRQSVVAFYGEMGAGKTTLIREIATQMDVIDNVTSPTFALVNQYNTQQGDKIYHFDFYRINKIEEAYDLGYEEYFDSGNLCLVEWPEKIEALLPSDALIINIEVDHKSESRKITVIHNL